jgi:5-methylcytosine-specific restriction endonuclease McrA
MAGKVGAKIYNTARWKRLRKVVLDAASWRCSSCGGYAREVHHRKRIADGGDPWDRANLEARCVGCHMGEHLDPEQLAWRRLIARVAREPRAVHA